MWTATCKKKKKKKKNLDHQLIPRTKINSRWIKDLNISHNAIKVLEEKIGRKISDIPPSNIFTDMSPTARDIKERINKWDFIKVELGIKGWVVLKHLSALLWKDLPCNLRDDMCMYQGVFQT